MVLPHLLTVFRQKQEENRPLGSTKGRRPTERIFSKKAGVGTSWIFPTKIWTWMLGLALCMVCLAGCGTPQPEKGQPGRSGPTKLTVVVLEDARLADTLRAYQGQWQAETGVWLEVHAASAERPSLEEADVLVFRSAQLGQLAEAGQIAPLAEEKLLPHSAAWSDLVELVRDQESRWGQQVYALPLGSPLVVCYCRADLLEQLGLRPPRTWEEYRQVAHQLKDRSRLGAGGPPADQPWAPALEPLGPGWAGWMLLVRAASYAKHPNYYSTLFEMQSMQPRIAEPPFVRALEELVAAAKLAPPDLREADPDQVRERFWRGQCGLALCWPSRAGPEKTAPAIKCTIVPIPGATAVWHPGEQKWLPAPQGELFRTPLLGMSGRWAAVGAHGDHPEAALQLIFWLAGKQGTEPRSAVCSAITLFRKSDLKDPKSLPAWVEPAMPTDTARQYADALQQMLSSSQWLVGLRIPGWQEYMAALDEAVHAAVRDEKTAPQALHDAVQKWQAITARFGLDAQRRAYRRNLGLAD